MTYKTLATFVATSLTAGLLGQSANQAYTPPPKAVRLDINSTYAELSPVRYGDRLYFSSMRPTEAPASSRSRIYSAAINGPAVLDSEMNNRKTTVQTANPAFLPDASRMYFTVCKDAAQADCEIWYRDHEYEGTWSAASKLPEPINLRGYSATQPTLGWDEGQRQFVLYFASNRPGGKGGNDIWACPIRWDGQFGTPLPMPFNTAADEVTPFFDRTNQALYFSSNGLGGLGRFDIFKAQIMEGGLWSRPEALAKPFNSAYDDLYCSFHEPSGTYYLVSDRPGSQCLGRSEGMDCYDIYEISPLSTTRSISSKADGAFSNN